MKPRNFVASAKEDGVDTPFVALAPFQSEPGFPYRGYMFKLLAGVSLAEAMNLAAELNRLCERIDMIL